MSEFTQALHSVFGERVSEMSPNLRERLRELWATALELGVDAEHTCGEFNPTTQSAVGPESCEGCQLLNERE